MTSGGQIDGAIPESASVDTPTQIADRDNRRRLAEDISRNEAIREQSRSEFDELTRQTQRGDRGAKTRRRMREAASRLQSAEAQLEQLHPIGKALDGPTRPKFLMLYEPDGHRQMHAVISVGDPDTAATVSVTIPGVDTDSRSLPGMVFEAVQLHRAVKEILTSEARPASTATIAWLGYDPPLDAVETRRIIDAWNMATTRRAREAAPNLAEFLSGIRQNNPTGRLSLLGHSYGSLAASLALQMLKSKKADCAPQVVSSAVFYGSPGLVIDRVDELGLPENSAYIMRTSDDPTVNYFAAHTKLHFWGTNPYEIDGIEELSTKEGEDPKGAHHQAASGHAGYPRLVKGKDGKDVLSTAGYNIAAIVAGFPELAIR